MRLPSTRARQFKICSRPVKTSAWRHSLIFRHDYVSLRFFQTVFELVKILPDFLVFFQVLHDFIQIFRTLLDLFQTFRLILGNLFKSSRLVQCSLKLSDYSDWIKTTEYFSRLIWDSFVFLELTCIRFIETYLKHLETIQHSFRIFPCMMKTIRDVSELSQELSKFTTGLVKTS